MIFQKRQGSRKARKGRRSGQISVMLCIMLIALVIFSGIFSDLARVRSGKAIVNAALAYSTESILAGYDHRLREEYGLFAFHHGMEDSVLDKYLKLNLNKPEKGEQSDRSFSLYAFNLEKSDAIPSSSLLDQNVARRQILDFMKYRAVKGIAEDVVDIVTDMRDCGKAALVIEKKISMEGVAHKADQILKDVAGSIYGTLNKFCRSKVNDMIRQLTGLYGSCRGAMDSADKLEICLRDLYEAKKNEKDPERKEEIEKDISEQQKLLSGCRENFGQMKSEFDNCFREIRFDILEPFLSASRKALSDLNDLILKTGECLDKISEFADFAQKLLGSSSADDSGTSILRLVSDEADSLKKAVPDKQLISGLIDAVNKNISEIESVVGIMEQIRNSLNSTERADVTLMGGLMLDCIDRCKTDLDLGISLVSEPEDPSRDAGDETGAGQILDIYTGSGINHGKKTSVNLIDMGIDMDDLPSHILSKESSENLDIAQELSPQPSQRTAGLAGILLSGLQDVRDAVYLNQYIAGVFKNTVTAKIGTDMEKRNIMGKKWNDIRTIFDSEIEYILNGRPSEDINRLMTEGSILLMRFGLNLLHLYLDPQKRQLALSMAAAASGWWSGGLAVPFVSSLLMCGWAAAESVIDLNDLLDGKIVPVYKNPGTKFKMPSLDYSGYVSILLLTKDQGLLVGRSLDLIGLNMGMRQVGKTLGSYYTCVTSDADVTMKYVFITGGLMKLAGFAEDERYHIRRTISGGY